MKKTDSITLSPDGKVLKKIESPWQQAYTDDTMKVIHVNDNTKSSELYMNYSGASQCKPMHSFGPSVRDHFIIHYIVKGHGVLKIKDKEYSLGVHQGFLLCPGVVSVYTADAEDPWEYMWVGFNGLNAAEYLEQAGLNQENPIFTYDKDDTIKDCMSQMVSIYDDYKKGSRLRLQSLLYEFLAILIENFDFGSPAVESPLQYKYIQESLSYIHMNYMDNLSVTNLAEYVGLNRSYLCSLFKKYLNTSPQSYISQYRINKGCELLTGSSYTISEISMMLGYKDPVVFQKFFKNVTGMAPRTYRKTHK